MKPLSASSTVTGTRKRALQAAAITVVLAGLALPRPALAVWGFTATLYEHGCAASVPPPVLPTIVGFPNQSSCDSARNFVLSVTESVPNPNPPGGTCTVGYNCTPCTGTDVSFSTSGPGSTLGGAFSSSVAPVFSPLQGSVTAVSPLGPDVGTATYTPHYAQSSQIWQKESDLRIHAFPTLNMASVPTSSYRYENRFADLVSHCDMPGCRPRPTGAGIGIGSSIRTMGPEYGPAEPARMSDDPSLTGDVLPMITIDESKAISLGGAGVQQQAAPDKAPPPTPVPINRGDHCPNQSWWYNTATHQCYGGGYDDCNNDNSAGRHRCVKK